MLRFCHINEFTHYKCVHIFVHILYIFLIIECIRFVILTTEALLSLVG